MSLPPAMVLLKDMNSKMTFDVLKPHISSEGLPATFDAEPDTPVAPLLSGTPTIILDNGPSAARYLMFPHLDWIARNVRVAALARSSNISELMGHLSRG